jgi:GDP/UDP-N,N'-diacetylbacillosamine 2-epimerase (hydrolysing)
VKKILFVLGSRGEWGYIKPIIEKSAEFGFESSICALNMVVLPKHGELIREIESSGFRVSAKILSAVSGDTHASMAKSIGLVTQSFTDVLISNKPDWVILSGDRAEQLGAAIASTFMYVPTAHIQAGERSGNIDGITRHAITKLVHLHFASNEDAHTRVLKLGEEGFRVVQSGAPQLDSLMNDYRPDKNTLIKNNLIPNEPYILVCFHPVTEEFENIESQINLIIQELSKNSMPKVWILPNNDAGGEKIRESVLLEKRITDQVFSNLKREEYISIMENAEFLIGNSSSGILEAPSLGIPVINLGRRQADRIAADNVIQCNFIASEIEAAIQKAQSLEFRKMSKSVTNPYGDGKASERILKKLSEIKTDMNFLVKSISY